MSASQIVKKTQPSTPMETDNSNQPPYPVQEDRPKQPAHIDRYQYVMFDSSVLEAIDRASLDAWERSVINPVIMEELDNIGKKYSDNPSTNNLINTDMVSIDGFHKDCPKDIILEIINIFISTYNIQIDINYANELLNKTYLEYSFATNRERFSIILRLVTKQQFSLSGSESKNQPAASCRVAISEDNATIPTLYATKYRCIAIAGNTQLLKPEITPIMCC